MGVTSQNQGVVRVNSGIKCLLFFLSNHSFDHSYAPLVKAEVDQYLDIIDYSSLDI